MNRAILIGLKLGTACMAIVAMGTFALLFTDMWHEHQRFASIVKGATAVVPLGNAWVRNLEPVADGERIYRYNDICAVRAGDTVTVVGRNDDQVLVSYVRSTADEPNVCPTGTLFFVFDFEFIDMTARYERNKAREEATPNVVRRLTEGQ